MRHHFMPIVAVAALKLPGVAFTAVPAPAKDAAAVTTVPMQLELNRPYIDVTLTGPNGRSVQAHAYVDTGGGALMLSAGLAERLGLDATGKVQHEQGLAIAPTKVPALRIGGTAIKLVDAVAFISAHEPDTLGHTDAEADLPARYLRDYTVVFDYPAHAFSIADPGKLKPTGMAVKTSIGESGIPVVWASVSGKPYGFMLDTGAQVCMVSYTVMKAWSKQHPDWARTAGAYGAANMLLGKWESKATMLRVATLRWGAFRIRNVAVVWRSPEEYEHSMSQFVGTPIVGSIGGNVLRDFRVTVAYPTQHVYLQRATTDHATSLDMVGIILEPAARGGYQVAGTLPGVKGIEIGDRLLSVDGRDVTRASFAHVVGWLSGAPGTTHTLVLKRGNVRRIIQAKAQSIFN